MAKFEITIINDPGFCGKDAADIPFVGGKAVITDRRFAEWFAQRPDIYGVKEIKESKPKGGKQPAKEEAAKEETAKEETAKGEQE